jgi:hypothetical protein
MNSKYLAIIAALSLLIFVRFTTATYGDSTLLKADVIKAELHTGTAEQNAYIDSVLAKVSNGTLPASLVDSTFQWSRKKDPKFRFEFFKKALSIRAKEQGITI